MFDSQCPHTTLQDPKMQTNSVFLVCYPQDPELLSQTQPSSTAQLLLFQMIIPWVECLPHQGLHGNRENTFTNGPPKSKPHLISNMISGLQNQLHMDDCSTLPTSAARTRCNHSHPRPQLLWTNHKEMLSVDFFFLIMPSAF